MASTFAGRTLPERPHAANEPLTNDRIAYLVGAPVATSRNRRRHGGIGASRFRVAPSFRYQRAEALRFLASIELSEKAGAFGDPAPRATTGACAMTLLDGQTQLRPRSLERHRADAAAMRGSLPPHGEPPW